MANKIYTVDLCYYSEENIPECGAVIFIRSDKDLEKIPKHLIAENIDVQEALEANCCEGIGNVYESSADELDFYDITEADLIDM